MTNKVRVPPMNSPVDERMRGRRYLAAALPLVIFAVALVALHHLLAEIRLRDVAAAFSRVDLPSVCLALAATAGSYLVLTGYEALALRYVGRSLPYRQAARTSFISYAFTHNIGLSLLTGGSIRFRIYSAVGMSAPEIARITGFCAATFLLGATFVLSLSLVLEPHAVGVAGAVPVWIGRAVGFGLLALIASYLMWVALRRRQVRLVHWQLDVPGLPITLGQFVLGSLDITFAATALYVLLPAGTVPNLFHFVGVYTGAITLGLLSASPGGLGVFEAVMLAALPSENAAAVFSALLLYRCVYYLLPFSLAATMLAVREIQLRWSPPVALAQGRERRLIDALAAQIMGTAVFMGGAVLLIHTAVPSVGTRMQMLRHLIPLPFVEASHLLGSVVGLWLLILAHGLVRRLDSAWKVTVLVLAAGIVFSLLRGLDWEEALILAVVLTGLLASRNAFYRRGSLRDTRFGTMWLALIGGTVVSAVAVGIFATKNIGYSDQLWWQFAYHGDAPRALRAGLVLVVGATGWVLYALLQGTRPRNAETPDTVAAVEHLVATATRTNAALAFSGDKRFLLSDDRAAFLMYQIQGRSWISLGDPVGATAACSTLVWRFRELCDQYDGRPVFYQVPPSSLPLYLDLGLAPLKLGEEARVELPAFTLAGAHRRDLRHAEHRATREGAEFDIIPAADLTPEILEEFREISDEWLGAHHAHEKGFSLGVCSTAYLRHFDCAVVRHAGRIVAFANLLQARAGNELSVDLMRHRTTAPYGVMDFLFTRIMLWAKNQSYLWFNLGMAPLSGLADHPLAPTWQRLGTLLFEHGEHFYNFQGLRAYKEKFVPVWESRYLAAPGGIGLPRVLLDVASLIAGGQRKLLRA